MKSDFLPEDLMARRRRIALAVVAAAAVAVATVLTVVFVVGGGDPGDELVSLSDPGPDVGDEVEVDEECQEAVTELDYAWSPVVIGGGGFVTGLITGPTGEVYARTDVGGAYRWDRETSTWDQMITASGVEAPEAADYRVESLAVAPSDGNVVYAAVGSSLDEEQGRVLRSDDGGRTWRSGDRRFPIDGNARWRQGGERLAVHPTDADVVLLGTRTEGLWRSEDGGKRWRRLDGVPEGPGGDEPAGVSFVQFAPGPVNGGGDVAVFAGVQDVGILRSDDGGASWRIVHEVDDGVPRHATLGPDGSLFVAVDGSPSELVRVDGATGETTSIGPDGADRLASVAVDPSDAERIFVAATGVRDGDLWRTDDGGDTWTALDIAIEATDPGWPERTDVGDYLSTGALAFDQVDPDTLWFAEGMGVWRTTDLADDELTWNFTSRGIEELVSNDAVKPAGHPLLTAHWDRPVFRHPDPGGAEPVVTDTFNAAWDLDVAPDDPSFVAAVVSDNRSCCEDDDGANQSGYSTDGGATWTRFGSLDSGDHPSELRFGNIAVSASDHDNMVWVPSGGAPPHYTTDGGESWTPSRYPGSEAHFANYLDRRVLTSDPLEPGTFYVLDVDGVARSDDGGATWEMTGGDGLPPGWALRFNATLDAVPGRSGELLLAVGELEEGSFGLLHSTDGGESWTELPCIVDAGTFGFGAPTTPGGQPVIFVTGRIDGEGLWRTDDGGGSWALVSRTPADRHQPITVVTGDPEVPGRVTVGFPGTGFVVGEPEGLG